MKVTKSTPDRGDSNLRASDPFGSDSRGSVNSLGDEPFVRVVGADFNDDRHPRVLPSPAQALCLVEQGDLRVVGSVLNEARGSVARHRSKSDTPDAIDPYRGKSSVACQVENGGRDRNVAGGNAHRLRMPGAAGRGVLPVSDRGDRGTWVISSRECRRARARDCAPRRARRRRG